MLAVLGIVAGLTLATSATAVTVPFVEDFSANASGWVGATSGPLTWNASGGPDGGAYVSSTLGSISGNGTIQFRANDALNASGDAFVGNWIGTVSEISASVIHNAPEPIVFFFRFAGPGAMVGLLPPVAPNVWTTISIPIDIATLTPAGGTFASVMAAVSNLQIGVSVPLALEGIPYTYGVDKVQIVPEPATGTILAGGLALLAWTRRRARR
jgi:hypothetical protein